MHKKYKLYRGPWLNTVANHNGQKTDQIPRTMSKSQWPSSRV